MERGSSGRTTMLDEVQYRIWLWHGKYLTCLVVVQVIDE